MRSFMGNMGWSGGYIYTNTFDFLQSRILEHELVIKPFSMEKVLKWWKSKSINRYKKLLSEGRLEKEFFWFDGMQKDNLKEWLIHRGKLLISEETQL